MLTKIYTKTGDNGKTGLIGGTRVLKSDLRLEAYGTVDELNSQIGLFMCYNLPESQLKILEIIQHKLFDVGSHLATDTSTLAVHTRKVVSEKNIEELEQQIDAMNSELPDLRSFILPGGSVAASSAHVCRTVARRAERRIVEMHQSYPIDAAIIRYLNRLSDYFFVLARYVSLIHGTKEIMWKSTE